MCRFYQVLRFPLGYGAKHAKAMAIKPLRLVRFQLKTRFAQFSAMLMSNFWLESHPGQSNMDNFFLPQGQLVESNRGTCQLWIKRLTTGSVCTAGPNKINSCELWKTRATHRLNQSHQSLEKVSSATHATLQKVRCISLPYSSLPVTPWLSHRNCNPALRIAGFAKEQRTALLQKHLAKQPTMEDTCTCHISIEKQQIHTDSNKEAWR